MLASPLKILGGGGLPPPLPTPMIGQKETDRTRVTMRKVNTESTRLKRRIVSVS